MSDIDVTVIDTNILLRHLLRDHQDHSPRASALLLRVRKGLEHVYCPDTAIFESIHILHFRAGTPRPKVALALSILIDVPYFHMTHKTAVLSALEFWELHSPLDFADCYHLALTKELGMSEIYTFDKKMDRYPGVERVEQRLPPCSPMSSSRA